MGEAVKQIPYLPIATAVYIMDVRAQVVQAHASIEDAIIVAAATGSSDFVGLANAFGESTAPKAVAPEAVAPKTDLQTSTQYFHLATPRPRERKTNTTPSAPATLAADERAAPENVDACSTPKVKERTSRWDELSESKTISHGN